MYKVYFIDNSVFYGGNIDKTKWNLIPKKPIKKIECTISGKTIVLENYESYNLFNEKGLFINRGFGAITKLVIMGKKDNNVIRVIYNFMKKKCAYDGKEFGKEWRGKSTIGWKEGLPNQKSMLYFK